MKESAHFQVHEAHNSVSNDEAPIFVGMDTVCQITDHIFFRGNVIVVVQQEEAHFRRCFR